MARGLNEARIIGYLGADPEMRYTQSGVPVCNFRVAVNREWRDSQGRGVSETTWFRVVAWQGLAEVCNRYLRKGSRVYVSGRLQNREWVDDQQVTRYAVELVAEEMILLDRPANGSVAAQNGQREAVGADLPY